MLLLLLSTALAATPFAGLQFNPISRADLVWEGDARSTGTLVGEFDGTANPALKGFGGVWLGNGLGIVGTLGIARLTTTTWVEDVWRQRHWGIVRPGLDLRFSLGPREVGRPAAWVSAGTYGDIPSSRDTSNGYTEEEQEDADLTAFIDRGRLGGFGFTAGFGVDYRVAKGIAVGGTYGLRLHRGVLRSPEAVSVSSWIAAEGALLLTFEW